MSVLFSCIFFCVPVILCCVPVPFLFFFVMVLFFSEIQPQGGTVKVPHLNNLLGTRSYFLLEREGSALNAVTNDFLRSQEHYRLDLDETSDTCLLTAGRAS